MPDEKSYADFKAAMEILETSLKNRPFTSKEMYRVVATQLSILLCDKDALIPRLFPDARFHLLYIKPKKEMESEKQIRKNQYKLSFSFYIPALFENERMNNKGSRLFNISKPPIKLNYWLMQPLFSKDFTIRDLIKLVRDKEGAHSDPKYPRKLKITNKIFLNEDAIHKLCINEIGRYILTQCKNIDKNYSKFKG